MVVALSPLPVRGQEVEGVDSSCRPLGSLLLPARAVCGRGLLTATARGVGALGLAVTGLDPWIDTGHTVTACGVTGGGLLTAPVASSAYAFSLPAGEIGVTASGRTLSRIARGQAGDYLAPARLRAVEPGRLARRGTQEGVEAFASQPPVVSESAAAVPPFARGAVFAALPFDLQDLARCF